MHNFCRRDSGHSGDICPLNLGSVRVLKKLRTWRRFYYAPANFVSVSHYLPHEAERRGLASHLYPQYDGTGHPLDDHFAVSGFPENINLITDDWRCPGRQRGPQENMIGESVCAIDTA